MKTAVAIFTLAAAGAILAIANLALPWFGTVSRRMPQPKGRPH